MACTPKQQVHAIWHYWSQTDLETMTMKKNWTLLIPIYNLEISNGIGGELRVDRVLFVSARKIPRIRKRLGLYRTVADYRRQMRLSKSPVDPFRMASTYAVLRTKREDDAPLTQEFSVVKEAVYLLASSQFFRVKRPNRILFGGPEFSQRIFDSFPLVCSESGQWRWSSVQLGPVEPYRLDRNWRRYIEHHHFPNLLRLLNGQLTVEEKWRSSIRRAAALAGQSFFARNLWEAFTYNMIALETLLTEQGDKFPDAIVERVVLLLGWMTDEDPAPWEGVIKRLYRLRCRFVHDGETGGIGVMDLHNADVILGNVLRNICDLTRSFRRKADVLRLTKEYKARKLLGLKQVRPRGLSFISGTLSAHGRKKLEEERHWWW